MAIKIDKTDKKIVDLLMQDGRMSCTDIAASLGNVSERSVRYRLDRLIRDGVIQVCAIVQPNALGFSVIGDVFIEVEPSLVQEVSDQISQYENVTYLASSIGETDISVQVVARNNHDLYDFVTSVIGKIQGVRKTTTSIVPYKHKDVYQWRIPDSAVTEDSTKDKK